MAKRLLKAMILPLTVMAIALAFVACGGDNQQGQQGGDTTVAKYKVTYELGAEGATGTAPTETDKAAGEKFKLKSADGITYEGKTFTGWNDGSAIYQVGYEYTMPSKTVTFIAQWECDSVVEPTTYNVTYKYGGATTDVVKNDQTAANYTVDFPTVYEDTGDDEYYKLFAGWTVENGDGTVYIPGAKTTLTGNTVFVAQWEEFDDDNQWKDTTDELQLLLLSDKVGAYVYQNLDDETVWAYFTYAVSGTAITLTPANGNPVTGTLDDGELTIRVTVGLATYNFAPQQMLPTFTFELNGGSGAVPTLTVTEEMYDAQEGCYVVTMPENTITPPDGKQFKEWLVTAASGGERRVAAGASYRVSAIAEYTVTPVWEDDGEAVPEGTLFYGNCTLPISVGMGGETVVKIILNNTDAANVLVYYQLVGEDTYTNARKGSSVQDSWKPTDVYGADALYYGSYILGTRAWNMVVKPDLTALWLCDTTEDEPLENGEFTTTPPASATYTVTYTNPNGAIGNIPEAVTVNEGAEVTLEADTLFTKDGWEFQGWQVNGSSNLREANATIEITANTTIAPVFGIEYTDIYNLPIIVRDDGYVFDGSSTRAYTLDGNTITVTGYGVGRLNDADKTIVFQDDYAGLTATAENGAVLTLDGFGGATLDTHVGTYAVGGSFYEPVLIITFGTVVVNGVEVLWDDYGYTAIGLSINATITLGGTDYVFGSQQEEEPVAIPQHFVGTFNGQVGTTLYVVKITLSSITVTIGNAAPIEAEVTDYDQIYKEITFELGDEVWYITKESGFDDNVDTIIMTPDEDIRGGFVLGRPSDTITIDPEYYGTFVGGGYTVVVTKYAVTVKNGDADAIVAELEDYDDGMVMMTLDGDGFYLYLDTLVLESDDETVHVTLTPDNGSEDEGNGVPAKFYGYYSDASYDYTVYIEDGYISICLPSWNYVDKEATSVEYYDYGSWGEGINITVDGVDYGIVLVSEANGQATSLELYQGNTLLATVTPVVFD